MRSKHMRHSQSIFKRVLLQQHLKHHKHHKQMSSITPNTGLISLSALSVATSVQSLSDHTIPNGRSDALLDAIKPLVVGMQWPHVFITRLEARTLRPQVVGQLDELRQLVSQAGQLSGHLRDAIDAYINTDTSILADTPLGSDESDTSTRVNISGEGTTTSTDASTDDIHTDSSHDPKETFSEGTDNLSDGSVN